MIGIDHAKLTTNRPRYSLFEAANRKPTQISRANDEAAKMAVGKTEVIKWKSTDGREIEGLLTYPVGYVARDKSAAHPEHSRRPGRCLPAKLHRRPRRHTRSRLLLHAAIARTAAQPDADRAATAAEFRRANIKDWGGMDYQDLMAGVDQVIARASPTPNASA